MEKRIREARKSKGLTLKQLGDILGISESAVSNIERARNKPSGSTLVLLCEKLGINQIWLETGEGEMFVQSPADDSAIVEQLTRAYHGSPVFRALMTTYLQLDEPRRQLLEEVIEGFCAAVAEARAAGSPEPDAAAYIQQRTRTGPESLAQ